uniref:Acyl-CoA binding domain containing 7 n=1 Tax=Amphiprion percula TaxID=161767 RepID=A0A3P8RTF1_AMPPE
MSDCADFEKAAEDVKKVKTRPTDEELLELYSLYKQATVGDVNTALTDPKGKAKWHAWQGRKGMSKDDSMSAYIKLATETISKYGV